MLKTILSVLVSLCPLYGYASDWTPTPKFSIDGGSYEQTLIFISGISYSLTYSDIELKSEGQKNFFCYGSRKEVSSELLIEIANSSLAGDHSSEEVMKVLINGLKEKYPCDK